MECNRSVTMAENFIVNYGRKQFTEMLKAFVEGTSNAILAKKLQVTRQRVHQWKRAFTKRSTTIKPEIALLV